MNRSVSITTFLLVAALGCREPEDMNDSPVVLEISVMDTIGVETGDQNYLFGDICCVDVDGMGRLLVLDAASCKIRIYTGDGEYINEFAGMGSGPGELLHPLDMTLLADGSIAVADWENWGVMLYDSDYSHSGYIGPLESGSPMSICSGEDAGIVGFGVNFIRDENHPGGEYYLGFWRDSTQAEFRYFTGEAEVDYGADGRVRASFPQVYFDTDPSGRVWCSVSSDSTYLVNLYSPSGEELICIQDNWADVPVDQATRAALVQEADIAGDSDFDPQGDIFAEGVTGVFCEDSSRVWIRLGSSSTPLFNVYNARGEFITQVSVPDIHDPLFETDFCITSAAIIAWNTDPVDYPKILLVENPFTGETGERNL